MIRQITLADVFVHMDMNSSKIRNALETYLKDKPIDYVVIIADRVNDRTKRFTKLELELAAKDLYNREQSPKIANDKDYQFWIENIIHNNNRYLKTDKYPSLDLLIRNNICLQFSPDHVFYDITDNTLTPVETCTYSFNTYEDIDWNDIRILYDIYRKVEDSKYYVRCVSKVRLESLKENIGSSSPYGLSRTL